jgi:small conductance mechanosensitive channel
MPHRSLSAFRGTLAALLLFLACAVALPAIAQPSTQTSSPTADSGLSATDLNALADQIQDEAGRRRLVETLRALAQAREASRPAAEAATPAAKAAPADDKPQAENDPGAAIVDSIVEQMRRAGSSVAALGALFSDLPSLQRWFELQIENPHRRALWTDVLLKLGAALLVAIGLQAVAYMAVRRSMAALAPRGTGPVWLGLVFMLLRVLVALVPTAVFAAAAYGTLALLAPNALTRDLAQIVVLAFVAWRAIDIAGQLLLAPDAVLARLLRLDGESAAYLQVWLRRLSAVGIFGYAAVRIAERVRIPLDGIDAIARLAAFIFAVLLAILALQNRSAMADRIRGSGDSGGQGARAAGLRVLRHRLAETWHILALLYIGAAYSVWAFEIAGGFSLILRGSLLTVAILLLLRALLFVIEHGLARLFTVAPESRARFPGLEARANRYLPLLLGSLKVLLSVVALFAILQAWGVDTFGWLGSDTGRNIVARLTTILLVVLVTLSLWEATAAGIEYYLTRPGADGSVPMRSGRVRTLLPLLRRFVSIVLGLIATLIVLSELGINIAPLLAGAGVIGLAIGFGAQTLVKDVITGIFILAEETVSVGDIVDLGGNGGVVEDISIRTIRLRDTEGVVHVIPFSEVTRIKNMTRGYARALFDIGVSYREDIDEVIKVIEALAAEFRAEPDWSDRILEDLEMWGVDQLADSAVVIRCRFKTLPAQQWSVRREFSRRIKKRFDELGIEIPFPHQTIYFGIDKQGHAPPLRVARAGRDAGRDDAPDDRPARDAEPKTAT